jgi:hypothetical protein
VCFFPIQTKSRNEQKCRQKKKEENNSLETSMRYIQKKISTYIRKKNFFGFFSSVKSILKSFKLHLFIQKKNRFKFQ